MVLSKVFYLEVISPCSLYIFFYNDSDHEISTPLRKHIQVSVVHNSACRSLYFWSYTPWKIGFLASPETSQKHVFRVKSHNLVITDPNSVKPNFWLGYSIYYAM
jgi:hypothetical protein